MFLPPSQVQLGRENKAVRWTPQGAFSKCKFSKGLQPLARMKNKEIP
jgi:hypothetical protein